MSFSRKTAQTRHLKYAVHICTILSNSLLYFFATTAFILEPKNFEMIWNFKNSKLFKTCSLIVSNFLFYLVNPFGNGQIAKQSFLLPQHLSLCFFSHLLHNKPTKYVNLWHHQKVCICVCMYLYWAWNSILITVIRVLY